MMKQCSSVSELVQDISSKEIVVDDIDVLLAGRNLVKKLVILRISGDLSQKDVAKRTGWKHGRVDGFENSKGENLTIEELNAYANAVGYELLVRYSLKPGELFT